MKQSALLLILLLSAALTVCAQSGDPDIAKYVTAATSGNADEVRRELPNLLTKYPNNPGVMYLQGLVAREGSEAIRTYQSIVDNFPQSEWADDALYRVYQFYYALGLYRTADIKLKLLKDRYPDSPYLKNVPAAKVAEAETSAPVQTTEASSAPVIPPPIAAPGTTPVPAVKDTTSAVRFTLQVGAFGLQANAQSLKERFESAGYPVEMISRVRDTRALFLVWVGNYGSTEEARAAGVDVKRKMGVDAIVVSR
jgi:cell division septation protein DedD